MSDSRNDRWAAGAGVLAAVLLAAGFVLIGVDSPGSDASRADVVATYSDDSTNARQAVGMLLTGLGALAFLPFLSRLRATLARGDEGEGVLPGAAFAGGVLLVAGVVAAAVLNSAVSAGEFFDGYRVDADIAMTNVVAGFYLYGFAGMAGGVLIVAAAIRGRQSGLLPKWLGAVGYAVAVLSIPAAAVGAWVLVECAWIALAAGLIARRSGTAHDRVGLGRRATA